MSWRALDTLKRYRRIKSSGSGPQTTRSWRVNSNKSRLKWNLSRRKKEPSIIGLSIYRRICRTSTSMTRKSPNTPSSHTKTSKNCPDPNNTITKYFEFYIIGRSLIHYHRPQRHLRRNTARKQSRIPLPTLPEFLKSAKQPK